jgi:large subunit ribosomal protein L15
MQIQDLKPKTERRRPARVGRGGKRGKTAGRGTKGQKARAGHKIRPEIRDLIKKLPKRRGYRFNSFAAKPAVVSLAALEKRFAAGTEVTPALLKKEGLARGVVVKILGGGEVTKALIISGCQISGSAKTKIEAAGGSIK